MRVFTIIFLFLNSCSLSNVQENSNFVGEAKQNNFVIANKKDDVATAIWEVMTNDSKPHIAEVTAIGKTPDGVAQTIFRLQCPTEQNNLIGIDYAVQNSHKITSFDFDVFEGPDAPTQKRKLLEIRAVSPRGNLSFQTAVSGSYGASNSFRFEIATTDRDKIMQLAQMVARGSTEVTFVIHDYRNNQKTIETTFPAIDASGEVAKMLNGCRK